MRQTFLGVLLLIFFEVSLVGTAFAQSEGIAGARVGVGTDISGGIAYGVQLNYTLLQDENSVEFGLTFFGGSFEEDREEAVHSYREETDVLAFGGMVNYLFRHAMDNGGLYFLAGAGAGRLLGRLERREPDGSFARDAAARRRDLPRRRCRCRGADPERWDREPVFGEIRPPVPGANLLHRKRRRSGRPGGADVHNHGGLHILIIRGYEK